MKKTFLFAIMMMAVLSAKAQLKVDTLGKVSIGSSTNSDASLYISNPNKAYGFYCLENMNDNIVAGIYNNTTSHKTTGFSGIYGSASGSSVQSGNVVGVKGSARGFETSNAAIGVWGYIVNAYPPKRGIGVLGSFKSSIPQSIIDTLYAGLFYGMAKVQGDLIVTGNIQGTLLAPAASLGMNQGQLTGEHSSKVMSNALKGLSANAYYHELTDEMIRAMNAENTPPKQQNIDYETLSDEEILAMEEATINSNNEEALPELSSMEKQILTKQHYGLDADQLEEVFPDLVYDNEDGSKSINYVEMVPILVQAINELNAKVEQLEGGSAANKPVTRGATNVDGMGENVVVLSLGQNKPNPFGATTSIEVSVPEDVQKAFIYVYDLQGKKVDQVDIIARGKQTIQVDAATLSDGMYLYSLIADGKVVETRRMIIEK